MKGQQTLECGPDGMWSSVAPECGRFENDIKLFQFLEKKKETILINHSFLCVVTQLIAFLL